ncbi:MAG TPA: molybdate ABC transporter substrate-binding protein [Longimicrobiaceae bacterium]|nr:molybdate ABC transporter substrate-binding protein [Longimicrobiaceae bacterium]
MISWIAPFVLILMLGGCADSDPDHTSTELIVSVAASLREVATELAELYMEANPRVVIHTNVGASGALQQQILNGAEVDIFIPAATRPMRELAAAGLVDTASIRVFARNRLVLIAPLADDQPISDFADLTTPAVGRLALGTPSSVPAGTYAEEALRRLGLWEAVLPKAVFGSSVRQVLTYVELGEVDAGLVYRTDAAASSRVRIVATVPMDLGIEYPAALVAGSTRENAAREYLHFILGDHGRAVLRRHGFEVPDA